MQELSSEQIYCSIDLELTGFDPTVDEILEVGFLLFRLTSDGLERLETWSQVFKPSKEIRPKILALTGITNQEVREAPRFSDLRELLGKKLLNTVLVGHSIGVDIRFLQSVGVTVPAVHIDTLDMAQVMLPTHHSYNLENLMHYLEITPHPSHRALADAEVTADLLYKLLGIGARLSAQARQQLYELASSIGFTWAPLLHLPVSPAILSEKAAIIETSEDLELKVKPKNVTNVPYARHLARLAATSCEHYAKPVLLVLSKPVDVIAIWRTMNFTPILNPAEQFSEEQFQEALKLYVHEPAALKFFCKVLVWKSLNWQSKSLLDLNILFSGIQYKRDIVGGELLGDAKEKLLVTDYETFRLLAAKQFYTERTVVIESVDNFYDYLSGDLGVHISWNQVLFILKSIYNPETDTGSRILKRAVTEAIAATDLFYGLVQLLLKRSGNVSRFIEPEGVDLYTWAKIERAGRHYLEKLREASVELQSEVLQGIVTKLDIFFTQDLGQIQWVEVSDARCSLVSRPLEVGPVARTLLGN